MSYLGQDPSLEVCLSAQHHLPVCSAPSLLSFLALLCRLLPLGPEDPRNPSASPQVLSGCAIIVRGQPRGGPPPERQINLSNIRAGNLARRAAAGQPDAKDTPDEVGASHEQCRAAPPLSQGSRVELDGVCVWGGGSPGCWPSSADHSTLGPPTARDVARSQTCCCRPMGLRRLPPCQRWYRMKQSLQSSFKGSFPCSSPAVWILGRISSSLPCYGHKCGQDGAGIVCC